LSEKERFMRKCNFHAFFGSFCLFFSKKRLILAEIYFLEIFPLFAFRQAD